MANKTKSFGEYKNISKAKKKQNRAYLRSYLAKYKYNFLFLMLITLLSVAQAAAWPKLVQILVDEHLTPNHSDVWIYILAFCGGLFGLIIIKVIASFSSFFIIRKFQQKIEMDLKRDIFKKIQKLEIDYFDNYNEGHFITRMMNDTIMAAEFSKLLPENVLNIITTLSIGFAFMIMFNWIIALVALVIVVIMIVILYFIRKIIKMTWVDIKTESDKFNTFFINSVSGIKEIKAYTNEKNEIKRYDVIANEYSAVWRRMFKINTTWVSSNTFMLSLMTLAIVSIGSWQVAENNLSIGSLMALIMYGAMITEPINKMLATFDIFIRGSVSLDRIFNLLNYEEEKYEGKEIEVKKGNIKFENVTLRYSNKMHALKNISFEIKEGEKVAFIGETGAGKSTILKALLKFYKITGGKIKIDDQDINKYSVTSLRENITYMSQDPFLFFDTIENNVLFGKKDSTQKDLEEAFKTSDVSSFMNKLPDGDQSNVGPRGVVLSGGQKQRIAIARSVIKNSKIILFDEATSALDNETEKKIQKYIDKSTKDKTVIYIAHRLTTIKDVDRIFVMKNGEIVESGSPKELNKLKGEYYKLANAHKN